MKIKLDENIPASISEVLTDLGHDVDTVPREGLAGADDDRVWDAVLQGQRFFVTQDLDFSDVRKFAPGTHPGLLILRFRNPGNRSMADRLIAIFSSENVGSWGRCFVVATEHKIRIRSPVA